MNSGIIADSPPQRDDVEFVEEAVRERLRQLQLDPVSNVDRVRRLVADAIDDHDRRSLTGAIRPIHDRARVSREVLAAISGLGPLQGFLEDPGVEEIWVNEPGMVFVARHGRAELTSILLDQSQVESLVERMLKVSGRRLDLSHPFVDAMLPGGERLHVVIPPITREHWAVNIRKFVAKASSLDDIVKLGSLSVQAARFLHAAVAIGLNILVSGQTQAGKTTMLGALGGSIPTSDRVVTIEEVFELRLPVRDIVALQTRQAGLEGTGAIPLRRLVTEALRMRPDRLVVGEVRQAEALDLLIALNSGLPGMCTIHANSARDAITKMCTLPLLAGENIGAQFVVPTVASAIDIVVQVGFRDDGSRAVQEILAVPGRVEGGVIGTADLFVTGPAELERANGFPPHAARFERAGFELPKLLAQPDASSGRETSWEA